MVMALDALIASVLRLSCSTYQHSHVGLKTVFIHRCTNRLAHIRDFRSLCVLYNHVENDSDACSKEWVRS
jgi:hypothetical protein